MPAVRVTCAPGATVGVLAESETAAFVVAFAEMNGITNVPAVKHIAMTSRICLVPRRCTVQK
jgi:hypothetical protein